MIPIAEDSKVCENQANLRRLDRLKNPELLELEPQDRSPVLHNTS